ncbi:MAG: nucleotidyltransferase family protein [Planctomycetota bacterium]|jgi:predicted nucleotidyltransferase
MSKVETEDILKKLRALKPTIVQRYKAKKIELFGSYTRQEQDENSDIDILVDFEDDADLFDFIGLGQFLEEELGQNVDVVPKRALRSEIRDAVLREAVTV